MGFSLHPEFRLPAPTRNDFDAVYGYDGDWNRSFPPFNTGKNASKRHYDTPRNFPDTTTTPALPRTLFVKSYYGFRYYSPELGRWPNRDPLGDQVFLSQFIGERNLNYIELLDLIEDSKRPVYLMINNDVINQIDHLGLRNQQCCSKKWTGTLDYDVYAIGASFVIDHKVTFTCVCINNNRCEIISSKENVKVGAVGFVWGRVQGKAKLSIQNAETVADLKEKFGSFYHAAASVGVSALEGPGAQINTAGGADLTDGGIDPSGVTDKPGVKASAVQVNWRVTPRTNAFGF